MTYTFHVVCEFDGEWTQERQIFFAKKIEQLLKPLIETPVKPKMCYSSYDDWYYKEDVKCKS